LLLEGVLGEALVILVAVAALATETILRLFPALLITCWLVLGELEIPLDNYRILFAKTLLV
jgi:hypothetical protein